MTELNYDFAKDMYMDSDFPKDRIFNCLNFIKTKEDLAARREAYDFIAHNDKISDVHKGYAIRSVNAASLPLFRILKKDESIPVDKYHEIFYNHDDDDFAPKIEMYNYLKQEENNSPEYIAEMLARTNKYSTDFIKQLYNDPYFSNENIPKILDYHEYDDNIEIKKSMYDNKLSKDKDLTPETITGILREVNKKNLDFTNRIYDEGIIPKDRIAELIHAPISDTANINIRTKKDFYDKLITKPDFRANPVAFADIMSAVKLGNTNYAERLIKTYKLQRLSVENVAMMIAVQGELTVEELNKFVETIGGKEKVRGLKKNDIIVGAKLVDLYGKQDINEIPLENKKDVLRQLVASNADMFGTSSSLKDMFPLIPKDVDEYCELLPAMVKSLGIETKVLNEREVQQFNTKMSGLADSLAGLSDTEFAGLNITQEFSKDDFIKVVLDKVKDLEPNERQKVYDYFGFELKQNDGNEETGYSIVGYPANRNNGKKLAKISDPNTKAVVESLRGDVIRFTENNPVHCENADVETLLNDVVSYLPELRTAIGKTQHGNLTKSDLEYIKNGGQVKSGGHEFDIMKHSLKVMQKITQDPKFQKLNDSDKKLMLLASLLHDITKREGYVDITRHLKLKCLTLKIKNFKFAFNLRKNF